MPLRLLVGLLPALLLSTVGPADGQLTEWRAAFRGAGDARGLDAFIETTSISVDFAPEDPVAQAFHATARLMKTGERRNPFRAWRSFRRWSAILEQQVTNAPNHADIRLLRLSVHANSPAFLRDGGAVALDCAFVAKAVAEGFWQDDIVHEQFVSTLYNGTDECH